MTVSECLGSKEWSALQNISIFPNPGHSGFILDIYSSKETGIQLEVLESSGKKVYVSELQLVHGQQQIQINLPELSEGMYFLSINKAGIKTVKKLLID